MTIDISDNDPRVSYTANANGAQTAFAVPFEFFDNADLNVYIAGVLKSEGTGSANYGVSGGAGETGTVTFVSGVTASATVVITRDISIERVTDFTAGADINRAALNTQLDTLTAISADLKDTAARALQLTDSDAAASLVLPAVADRKGKVLAFHATTGAVEAGPSTSAVQSVADNAVSVNLLGTAAVVEDMGLLATAAAIEDMSILGTSTIVADMAILATDAIVADMAILATSDIVADMNTLATDAIVADMNLLATAPVIEDMGLLATAAVIEDMGQLANSTVLSNIATLAGDNSPNVSAITVGGASQLNGTLTVGANDQGYDVTLHGDTAARNVVWDSSADSLIFSDNAKATFGAGSDLQIYHDPEYNNSVIKEGGTGDLLINASNFQLRNSDDSKAQIIALDGGAVTLYHNNAAKLATTATGAAITGAVKPTTYQETYVAASAASTVTLNLSTATNFSITLGQATTFAFSNPPSTGTAYSFTLIITQHSTAVSITWPSSVDWAGGSAPDAALANEVQAYGFITRDGGTTYYGFLGGTAIG
jgi:hypothetical protein